MSPDGSKIAFTQLFIQQGTAGLYTIRPDGTGQVRLSDLPAFEPRWSPDGKKILVKVGSDLGILKSDGTGLVRITAPRGAVFTPSWSPDSNQVAFVQFDSDVPDAFFSEDVYVASADGTNIRNLTNRLERYRVTDWQPIPAPRRAGYKNASSFCRAEQAFWGDQFKQRYGGRANAYGKCVSGN